MLAGLTITQDVIPLQVYTENMKRTTHSYVPTSTYNMICCEPGHKILHLQVLQSVPTA